SAGHALVSQDHRTAIEVAHNNVHISVIEKVADRKAARYAPFHQRRTGQIAGVTEGAVFLVEVHQLRLTIAAARWERINLGIDMPAGGDQVKPAIIVEINERIAPF